MLTKLQKFVEWYGEELFLIAVVFLVGMVSFGLGRLSGGEEHTGGMLRIESTPVSHEELQAAITAPTEWASGAENETSAPADLREGSGTIVGNKNSNIYHREDCSGARLMNEENKVYFATAAAAKAAGYRPAGNCPGLE